MLLYSIVTLHYIYSLTNKHNSIVHFKTTNLLLISRPDAHTNTLLEELRGSGIVQWAGLLHWAGVLQGPRRRRQQTGTSEERTKPEAENKTWSTQSHSHPQGLGQAVMNCYQALSSVMPLIAAHTLWARACTFIRLRTPTHHVTAHSAHLLLITMGVYTLTSMPYFLLFIPSIVICYTSSSCGAPNATLPDPRQSCQQWRTGLAGGHLSPTTCEEIRFSTCNFKQLSSHLSERESYFFPDVKKDTLWQRLWQKFKTWPDIVKCVTKLWHLTKRPDHLCGINLPWGLWWFHLKHGQQSNHHKTDCLSYVWKVVQCML